MRPEVSQTAAPPWTSPTAEPGADSRQCSRQFTGPGPAITSAQTIHKAAAFATRRRKRRSEWKRYLRPALPDWMGGLDGWMVLAGWSRPAPPPPRPKCSLNYSLERHERRGLGKWSSTWTGGASSAGRLARGHGNGEGKEE